MIDVEKMKQEIINRRKEFNRLLKLNQEGFYECKNFEFDSDTYSTELKKCEPFRLKEEPLDENPDFLVVHYKNGNGAIVIDVEEFKKMPLKKKKLILEIEEVK